MQVSIVDSSIAEHQNVFKSWDIGKLINASISEKRNPPIEDHLAKEVHPSDILVFASTSLTAPNPTIKGQSAPTAPEPKNCCPSSAPSGVSCGVSKRPQGLAGLATPAISPSVGRNPGEIAKTCRKTRQVAYQFP